MTIEQRVIQILSEQLNLAADDIRLGQSISDDLKADSIDIVELALEAEDEFQIEIPDEDWEQLRTVADAVKYVESKVRGVTAAMRVTAISPWFGADRMLADDIGRRLKHCSWVGVPFGGGLSALTRISATTIVASDKHCHVVNLANVVKDDSLRRELIRQLDRTPFHAAVLDQSQEKCKVWESRKWNGTPILEWAVDYFCAAWIGRSALAGSDDEFCGGISARWNSNGGDSNTRFRSAIHSLVVWGKIMRRTSYRNMDGFELLAEVQDNKKHGVYADPPFPDGGKRYKFNSGTTESEIRIWHTKLRDAVERFDHTTVVMRYYDHPLIRELYPETEWRWNRLEGRKQSNEAAAEVLIVNDKATGELF